MNTWEADLLRFGACLDAVRGVSKTSAKLAILRTLLQDAPDMYRLFNYALSPFVQFHLTSATAAKLRGKIKKEAQPLFREKPNFKNPFAALSRGKVSGHKAAECWNDFTAQLSEPARDAATCILDKDLKGRIGVKLLNKVLKECELPEIGTFSVALGTAWKGEPIWEENAFYHISRKLDGVRCICILQHGCAPVYLSRQGKPFETLGMLSVALASGQSKLVGSDIWQGESMVLDGELSVRTKDGADDFRGIMHEIRRKDHTIKNPVYHVFDMLTMPEFETGTSERTLSTRIAALEIFVRGLDSENIVAVKQGTLWGAQAFSEAVAEAKRKGWEGLIVRRDAPYVGKRSKDMYKVKSMQDAEYKVIDVEIGERGVVLNGKEIRVKALSAAVILHKKSRVGVGSGWTQAEAIHYAKHPEELIGKTITVQYFEETQNDKGGYGLRFPVVKCIHGATREL